MKIGIITAMPEERRAVARAIGAAEGPGGGTVRFRSGTADHDIVLVESGMGPKNAETAAEKLVRDECPDLLLSAGFCGGIRPGLEVGDAVLAGRVLTVSVAGAEEVPVVLPDGTGRLVVDRAPGDARLVYGLFATTQAIMGKQQLARLLPAEAPHPVAEMESATIARVAAAHGIPFIGLRTVSDPWDEELGFSLDEFCDDRMRIRIPRVLLTVARKPRIIPQLIRLARNSRIAADSLSRAIAEVLSHI